MNDKLNINRRESFKKLAGVGALSLASLGVLKAAEIDSNSQDSQNANKIAQNKIPEYADSDKMMLPKSQMKLTQGSVGLVVVNPQIDFLSPKGVGWNIYGANIKENGTIENIGMLLRVAKALALPTFISYVVWNKQDFDSMPKTPMKNFIRGTSMCLGKGSGLNANDISNSGADFLPEYKPFILDNKSVLTTPRKDFGLNGSNLVSRLRQYGVRQVILCGMDANTHIDSHLRDLLAEGFDVGVVRDATAGAKLPEGDGYLAALINFRYIANELFYTSEIVPRLQGMM
ncbi:isochorismatase family protein [Helicobacter saguini]|uniref:Cysteine hydrolase n=1 Tax=Helicobacter saguini TaxID=1548018 RepID=A0A347VKH7_9HELI|nr:isochorismatase family cysteine hydrolase [Helicobacter saguini]MWV61144.1 isochorismatase family protein [Helicobacter saguini]MWV68187.1 isochorismatase family protein [Helicobacter saguini]MWV70349.1 isochorismatase family protein [Helicobacter saguini]MWV72251.1 isochorismatase family protein [Helicobacter saguini]TLD95296.1 cysteine hydrolase [Helicobacter saguini]